MSVFTFKETDISSAQVTNGRKTYKNLMENKRMQHGLCTEHFSCVEDPALFVSNKRFDSEKSVGSSVSTFLIQVTEELRRQ